MLVTIRVEEVFDGSVKYNLCIYPGLYHLLAHQPQLTCKGLADRYRTSTVYEVEG